MSRLPSSATAGVAAPFGAVPVVVSLLLCATFVILAIGVTDATERVVALTFALAMAGVATGALISSDGSEIFAVILFVGTTFLTDYAVDAAYEAIDKHYDRKDK